MHHVSLSISQLLDAGSGISDGRESGLDRFHRRFRRTEDPIHPQYGLLLGQILLDIPVSNEGTIKKVQKMTRVETDTMIRPAGTAELGS